MKTPNLLEISLGAALLSAIVYIGLALRHGRPVDLRLALECLLNGASIPGGSFLILCAFIPEKLFRIIDDQGKIVGNLQGYLIEVEGEKRLCILVGGFAIVFLSTANLIAAYRQQRQGSTGKRTGSRGRA